MKLGINLLLWTAAADDSHLSLIEQIQGWGYDGVEFPMFAPDASPWKAFAKQLDDLSMSRTAVAVLPEGANLIGESDTERRAAIDYLKACIDSCVVLGAEHLVGPVYSPVGRLVGRGPTDDERARCVEGLKEAGEHADQAAVSIAVEPLNRFETYFLNAQADAADLLDRVGMESVGVLYDTFHANIEEKDIAESIEHVADRLFHVHVSANDRATPGEDHIDWETTFKTLKTIGYDGWLVIESFGAWLPELAAATCIWREMAPNAEHVARAGAEFVRKNWKG